jgi:hypothetical protein
LQQLHIHTPPELAVPSVEQGPRQGPGYSKEGTMIAKIYTDNKLFIDCQGIPLQSSIVAWEKEHPSQRVYTTFFTDRRYHNQAQAPSYQQPP